MRLIDADALMDVIRQHEYHLATKQGSIDYGMFTLGIQQAVDEQPTVDAAPVVRCKDCLYSTERYGHMDCMNGVSYRNTWNKPDFYCAYGERKEGAD